ncbi:hypothetical protein Mpal_0918 [Methanosphaerula palustris E1-9c]|uniref:Uncharacterized protein n=1 Tax=Methanosphaerula palustris (strain ATCC BAA-1556 / DSM 19958 / E1-9c) TaxID=521011 RepID=B8GGL7_METPE|nr:hypothetical protein Mpal_0918 [Methanosphaerula palustris E1-9c]
MRSVYQSMLSYSSLTQTPAEDKGFVRSINLMQGPNERNNIPDCAWQSMDNPKLMYKMAKQLKFSHKQFCELVDCSMNGKSSRNFILLKGL